MALAGAESSTRSAPELVREVRAIAVAVHDRFEREVWTRLPEAAIPGVSPTPSYHNGQHVAAVCDCAQALLSAYASGSDPFGLSREARRWSEATGEEPPDLEELRSAFGVAFACHDLGNIASSALVTRDGPSFGLELARFYDSSARYATPAVEVRSAAIARAILASRQGKNGREKTLAPLVEHLVLQTVFHFEKDSDDAPFWTPVQVVDMIGSYFFLSVPRLEAIAGLFAEMRMQKPGSIPVLPFLTSLEERFNRLVPDPGVRREVLAILERNGYGRTRESVFAVPERFRGMTRPVPYEEAIATLLAPG